MSAILDGNRLVLGTCYYPEHWPERLWREDIERMLSTGIEVIRIAEFAWNKTEPEEGVFTYDFFDRFLDLCDELGLKVIFGTPTATPPAWLTERYPEVLNVDVDGLQFQHGARRHYNYNAPVYRYLTERIVTKLAEHYAPRKCIIGWQIDNELNCETDEFHSEADSAAFRLFLKDKYGTLEALNRAWGTVFWNQTYTSWEQVHVPRKTISNSTNPHEVLDYTRFVSSSARSFCKLQSDIIRKYLKPGDFITTNGMFASLDNHQMTDESLDFYTYDSYPNFAYCLDAWRSTDTMADRRWSRNLTEVRSICPVFGIMEQQSGANGWNTRMEAPTPRPGQLTLWTMQSIAHGADFVSYFRWRTATMGTEIYWHGILDYSGRENRRIAEVRAVREKLAKLDKVAGARYAAEVALVKDYDNEWDARLDKWHGRVAWQSEQAIFNAAQRTHTPLDYVYLDHTSLDALKGYKVLFCPHLSIMTGEKAELLEAYVRAGGTVVFGCRTAYKDVTGQCVMDKLPGVVAPLTAADIPEYSFIAPDAGTVTVDWGGDTLEAAVFADLVEPTEGGVREGVYTADYYAGAGALVSHQVGEGKAYYYGTAFTESAARTFLEKLGVAEPCAEALELPEGVELTVRKNERGAFAFVLNYLKTPVTIGVKKPCVDLLTGETLSGDCALAGYGVMVLAL
ncbi:MAG: beta-galactosidase [Clostridiales bacterium]|nr:beta-galactosidase [Clostridiales bacterium]